MSKQAGDGSVTRRDFVRTSAVVGAAALTPQFIARAAHTGDRETIRVGVIGCGGRGTGAAGNSLEAYPETRIVGLADLFQHRIDGCRDSLTNERRSPDPSRAQIDPEQCYTGFDAYKKLLADGLDYVIIATPPHFRPMIVEEAVRNNTNIFMEKPVATDPVGIRRIIAAGEEAKRKGLSIVSGTQRRHEACYLKMMEMIRAGAIGDVVSARCYWNQGGLWVHEKQPEWSDMEWQIRNWLYFTWLSGDHIVEQHIHNLDVCNWAIGSTPIKCTGMGGREVRVEPRYGHIFDHFAIEYEYPGGVVMQSYCRQIDGCAGRVAEAVHGTKGQTWSSSGHASMKGETNWTFREANPNPYMVEHKDLIASITGEGPYLNEAKRVAESTLTAIMGRMSAYTGKEVTWDFAMNESKLDLSPPSYEFGPLPVPDVAVPGQTPLV